MMIPCKHICKWDKGENTKQLYHSLEAVVKLETEVGSPGLYMNCVLVSTLSHLFLNNYTEAFTLVWPCLRNQKTSGMCMYSC
jgi:hypothetical protein